MTSQQALSTALSAVSRVREPDSEIAHAAKRYAFLFIALVLATKYGV